MKTNMRTNWQNCDFLEFSATKVRTSPKFGSKHKKYFKLKESSEKDYFTLIDKKLTLNQTKNRNSEDTSSFCIK